VKEFLKPYEIKVRTEVECGLSKIREIFFEYLAHNTALIIVISFMIIVFPAIENQNLML
jgi:hypothetical protein